MNAPYAQVSYGGATPPPNNPGPGGLGLQRDYSVSTWETETFDGGFTHADSGDQQEIPKLHILCDAAQEDDVETWNMIRDWVDANRMKPTILVAGAETLGDYNTTPLHLACRNCPPVDIVQSLLNIAPHTVQMNDSFSWLPLHYACANGASLDVLRILVEAYPESRSASDKRGRTPLHFALGNTQRPASPAVVELLVASGAATCSDENGMLPLHYACAYGISQEALRVLTNAFPESITATDNKGRTPLHFALGNADRTASPLVVKHLLSENREIVNSADKDGQLPLHLLSTQANRLGPDQKNERNNATKCLDLYLNAAPRATADFFTALQALPGFLRQQAVVTPLVQDVLNYKISKRFPTMILILDFYFIVLIIVFFRLSVSQAVNERFPNEYMEIYNEEPPQLTWWYLLFLYFGGLYFLLREIIQMISLASLGLFKTWLFDGVNLLDVSCIFIVFFWAIVMQTDSMTCPEDDTNTTCLASDQFRSGTAVSTIFIWLLVLSFLKSTLIDFAVFVNGLFYVVQRLVAFLLALVVILVGFAQMFVTVFQGSQECINFLSQESYQDRMENYFPFCDFWNSLLKVYTMLLGEVDESLFVSSVAATWLFVAFMFLVVILLANVLIAIVTDRYVVIKNQRAQIVFWSNRLDYVAEIDLISSGPWISKVIGFLQCRCCIGSPRDRSNVNATQQDIEDDYAANLKDTFGQGAWKNLIALYEDQDLSALSLEFYCYLIFRFFAGVFLIPLWLVIGLASAGFLWPPQVREWLFVQRIAKRSKGDTLQEQRLYQMNELKAEVKKLQEEIKVEMTTDRKEVDGMKTQLTQMKSEMTTEMKQIKEIMTMLYDLQSTSTNI